MQFLYNEKRDVTNLFYWKEMNAENKKSFCASLHMKLY